MAKLTFVLEDGQEVVVPLKEHTIIGRDEDNDIVVDDERISPRHAEIVQNADGSLQVFDLKSAAGTFVNGESQLSCTLLHGDTIAFGPLVGTLDLEHPATAAPILEKTAPAPTVPEPPPSAPAAAAPLAADPTAAAAAEKVHAEAMAKLEAEKARLKAEVDAARKELQDAAPKIAATAEKAHAEAMAKLEAEKARLKTEVDAARKELQDWQQRAEKERALHLARVESLSADEARLEPMKAAVQQAESAHHEWLEAISTLTRQHDDKSAALERLNAQHYEKSTEVQRLTATATETRQKIETLAAQQEAAAARLKQVRDECEQDEALLNSLRQQIIEHEKRIVEEEAKHAALTTASAAFSAKQQREQAAIKDLESLLMKLEQEGAAAEGALQQMQANLAVCEKALAARNAELAACEKSIAACGAELAAENQRLAEAKARRAEMEQQSQELVGTQQQLADARKRLAAVELRYRDALADGGPSGSLMAAPKRHGVPEDGPKAATPTDTEVTPQIEAARRELAELEAKIAALKDGQPAPGGDAPEASAFPAPVIVQVETIKLAPIKIKSERARGPGTKKATAS